MERKFPVIISEYSDVYLEWYVVIPHWKFYIKRMETSSPLSFRFFATRQAGIRLSRDKCIRAQECHVDVIVCEKTGPSMKKTRYSSNRSANLIVQNKLN